MNLKLDLVFGKLFDAFLRFISEEFEFMKQTEVSADSQQQLPAAYEWA